jgi:hypothetical protein
MTNPAITFLQFLEGRLARTDLLAAEISIATWISLADLCEGSIVSIRAEDFSLEAGINDGILALTRNGYTVQQPLYVSTAPNVAQRVPLSSPCHIAFTWSPTRLAVYVNAQEAAIETPPTLPPNSLLRWARREAILPVTEYASDRAFCDSILNGLAGLQDKITIAAMQPAFWDFTYDGKKIVSRRPKRETQVHPTIHGLLHDLSLAKNITIHPEATAGSGRLDFLLTGIVRGGSTATACVEFKHAHSDDVVHGLTIQLPEYMKTHATNHGFYCVPWFKGDHFDQPKPNFHSFRGTLVETKAKAGLDCVNLVLIDVSGGVPPSKATST